MGVSTMPGETQLTLIPSAAHSWAMRRVSMISPALETL
jgi:hypothetical protein